MRTYKIPPEIKGLTADQRDLLDAWLEDTDCTLAATQDRCRTEFQVTISVDKLRRYNQKRGLLQELTDAEADVEDLLAIYNGEPSKIPEAALNLLYARAFRMIADPKTKKSLLMPLFRIVTYKDRLDWFNHKKHIADERLILDKRKETTREKTLEHRKNVDIKRLEIQAQRLKSNKLKTADQSVGDEAPAPQLKDDATECSRSLNIIPWPRPTDPCTAGVHEATSPCRTTNSSASSDCRKTKPSAAASSTPCTISTSSPTCPASIAATDAESPPTACAS